MTAAEGGWETGERPEGFGTAVAEAEAGEEDEKADEEEDDADEDEVEGGDALGSVDCQL